MLNIIRDYPTRQQDYKDLHEQKITASTSGMPGGAGAPRPLEQTALRTLPPQEQREYDAVHQAILRTQSLPNANERLEIIKLTMWRSRCTLHNAADMVHISERTARRFRHQFILLVGLTYGFLSELEYIEAVRKDNTVENRTPKAREMVYDGTINIDGR